ncbi:MAG: winged helix-turn-helix domain-containing protein [Chloroflexota bacterium]|nr:winged helix-turn-helix domain-containing protein [Chloroflexota bacterium]
MTLPKQSEIYDPLLDALAEWPGGEARPQDLYPAVTSRFTIDPIDLAARVKTGANQWTIRIQFARLDLVRSGYLHQGPPGLWRLTDSGWARARDKRRTPLVVKQPTPERVKAPVAKSVIRRLPSTAESAVRALRDTEHDSAHPSDYEVAVADAFSFLGFEVEHVGGAGDTDVVADAPLGTGRYRMILDTKTAARGAVANAQIDWPTIVEHRDKREADYALVTGPDFAGGNLQRRAEGYDITLLTTKQIVTLVQLHQETPFTLEELRPVFARRAEPTAFNELRALSHDIARRWLLLTRIVEQINAWNRLQPNLVLGQTMVLFASLAGMGDNGLDGVTPEEVEDAVTLLSSRAVGVLRRTSNASEGFVLTAAPAGVRQRLIALVRAFDHLNTPSGDQAEGDDGEAAAEP